MSYEVELKFAVHNREELARRLQSMGSIAHEPVRQEDRYFNHPARDFAKTDEAFRIRRDGDTNRITYKGPKIDQSTKTRREIEIAMEPGDAAREKTAELLRLLGFIEVRTVAKTRTEYEFDLDGRCVHAALDEVEGLGSFAELETIADEDSLAEAKACLKRLAEQLHLGETERRSYLQMLLQRSPS